MDQKKKRWKSESHMSRNNSPPTSWGSQRNVWNWKGKPWYKFRSPVAALRSVIHWAYGNESRGFTAEDSEEYRVLCALRLNERLNRTLEHKRKRNCKMWERVRSPDAHSLPEHQSFFLPSSWNRSYFPLPLSLLTRGLCLDILPQAPGAPLCKGSASCSLCACPGTNPSPSKRTQVRWSRGLGELCEPQRCSLGLVLWVCV